LLEDKEIELMTYVTDSKRCLNINFHHKFRTKSFKKKPTIFYKNNLKAYEFQYNIE